MPYENEEIKKLVLRARNIELKRPKELRKLFEISPSALEKLYYDILGKGGQFESKNIQFNLEIQGLLEKVKIRKIQAYIVAHSYVAWYEWIKNFLNKIYKTKLGKGPKNDDELIKFLEGYPSWKYSFDTTKWGIKPNQIRNCISHEKFWFDYRHSQIVFMTKKEKRVPLRYLRRHINSMSHFYATLLRSLKEKLTTGEISYGKHGMIAYLREQYPQHFLELEKSLNSQNF